MHMISSSADASVFSTDVPKFMQLDWEKIAYVALCSRYIDETEETVLLPARKIIYQFSARGHDVYQIVLGSLLTAEHDAVGAYYRSRPLLITLGLSLDDAFAAPMAKAGGFSDGRDIGVVCNLPKPQGGACVIPMSGDVGSQYTPIAGWAQSILYRKNILKDHSYTGSIGVAHGGDASVATNGFWSALSIATTLNLPMLFYIEDNGYGISVPSSYQTPGGNIAENLKSFKNLFIKDVSGCDLEGSTNALLDCLYHTRAAYGPALCRITVPRLSGHSGQDTQSYKNSARIDQEKKDDPLLKLRDLFCSMHLNEKIWNEISWKAKADVERAVAKAEQRAEPDPKTIEKFLFFTGEASIVGGMPEKERSSLPQAAIPKPEPTRINFLTAVRRTLEHELRSNKKMILFGEDIGPKGGVHGATLGLQETFGIDRVFDTSLSEEGIIGRAVGMALAGLMPVPEIQFRKYADPATEQLNNCGTMRWRTNNRFSSPIVVRMPGGFAKVGDPWHSVSNEVFFAHAPGWKVAYPSNAEDAVGLLRSALRGSDPVVFFEHRHLLDSQWARRPYPGDEYYIDFGKAAVVQTGSDITVVTWGAMVERVEFASRNCGKSVEIIDLRTISPWDKDAVLRSVQKTKRCIVVHEDGITAGFGAEIVAAVVAEKFFSLDAPIKRLAIKDIPIPYNVSLMDAVVPTVSSIAELINEICDS